MATFSTGNVVTISAILIKFAAFGMAFGALPSIVLELPILRGYASSMLCDVCTASVKN